MTSINDVLESKGGEWFTPNDVEKKILTIIESIMPATTQIREHATGKKYKNYPQRSGCRAAFS